MCRVRRIHRFYRIPRNRRNLDMVLGGGGVRGIAYAGVVKEAERLNLSFGQIAGTSAGAMLGSLIGAGFNYSELRSEMDQFSYESMKVGNLDYKIPEFARFFYPEIETIIKMRSEQTVPVSLENDNTESDLDIYRGKLLKNIITYTKEGYIFEGDYLEEWMYKTLLRKGIKTFGDLKYEIPESGGAYSYKVLMNAVDVNRAKAITLPHDIKYYGIEPDKLEVSKAVRMSTSIPLAFKPVVLKVMKGNQLKAYNIVDGGVYNNFPQYLLTKGKNTAVGFKFSNEEQKAQESDLNRFNIKDTLLYIKALISFVLDIGFTKMNENKIYVGDIVCPDVTTLDFDMTAEKRNYLVDSGEKAAKSVFKQIISIA